MPGLADLPADILDVLAELLVKEKHDDLRWDQFPLDSYAEDSHSNTPSRALANLTQVNGRLRNHFQAVLWRDITIYYVSDVEKLDRFLSQPAGSMYGKLVRNLMLSWWDDVVGNEFEAEADISQYEEEELGLGPREEWIFKDRIAWWFDVSKSQLREQYPEWTEEQVERTAAEPLPYPYTSGPDGRGPVPHMSSMHDVEEALKGIFDRLCFVKHVDWNSRLLSFPGWLSHRLQKLESLVLLHEDFRGGTDIVEDCTALSGCCRQIRSLTLIDFKHDLGAYDDVKIHYPRLRFCPASEDSPVGIKIEDDAPSDPKQPLHIICQSLLEGISHQLRTLTLEDGNLLRVEKLLPVFLRLDSVSCPRDGRGAQHHWDWAVESDPAPFAALRDLRDRLSSSQSLQDLRDECADILRVSRAVESAPQVAVVRSAVVPRPSVEDFAKWLIDDSLLAERAYLALDRRGDRSQVN